MPKAKEKILDESVNLSENIPKTAKTMAQGYTKFIFTRDVKPYSVPYLKFQNTHKWKSIMKVLPNKIIFLFSATCSLDMCLLKFFKINFLL